MTKETTYMQQQAHTELKGIARAIGASLKRSGHDVPHSHVLHAVAAALNQRDWHKLKSTLSSQNNIPATQAATPVTAHEDLEARYSDRTKFWLRLAMACGKRLTPDADDMKALEQARAEVGNHLDGVLRWSGWNLPATLQLSDSTVDAGDFRPEKPAVGTLVVKLELAQLDLEVAFSATRGWFLTSSGAASAYAQMEQAFPRVVPEEPAAASAQPAVQARFWTDDREFEVEFDARAYLEQASDEQLCAIIDVGYGGDYATDAIAEFMLDRGLNQDITEAFEYLNVLNRSRRRESTGFECKVDPTQFLTWMDANRQPTLAKLLCEHEGIRIRHDSTLGLYFLDIEGSHSAHPSEEDAALAAYRKLGMLATAIEQNR